MSIAELLGIISVAFFSSFGHCYSMCGGFNLAFNKLNENAKYPFFLSIIYHFARILAYIILGVIFGAFGGFLALSQTAQSIAFFALGIFMIALGFSLIFRTKLLALLENSYIFDKTLAKFMKKAMKIKGVRAGFMLGFLNGFIPCGLVYFFLASAISKDALNGGLIMLIFGLSTLPALLIFAKISQILSQNLRQIFNIISYILIIIYGINLAFMGFNGVSHSHNHTNTLSMY